MVLPRLPDWPERLAAVIARHQAARFTWGRFDCATLLADCVEAMTGRDPLAEFRPWSCPVTARAAVRRAGHATVESWVRATFTAIPVATAGRGDLGYPPGPLAPLMFPAVITGPHAVSWTESGWCAIPRDLITEAFRI